MSPIARQTVTNKDVSFWQIVVMIIITVVLINLSMTYFNSYGPVYGSIAALASLVICTVVCILIIYKKLSYYNYRIIDDELMLERVIGRSNHIFFHVNVNDIDSFMPYKDIDMTTKNVKLYRFVIDKNKNNWYAIQFIKDKKTHRIIIEPDTCFLGAMRGIVNTVENNRVIS